MKTVIIGATCAILAASATALAGTSHIVGRDGPQVKLSEACTRLVVAAPGENLNMTVNVIGQQVHCLIRRPDAFARCVRHANLSVVETADHGRGRPGDEIGAKDALMAIQTCAHAKLSTTVPQ